MSISILLIPTALSAIAAISTLAATEKNTNKKVEKNDITTELNNQNKTEEIKENNINDDYHIIITEMNDETILNDVLAYFNYNIAVGLNNREPSSDIIFYKNEENNFISVFSKSKERELIPVLEKIRNEYGKKIQEKVYKEVLEKYKHYNFVLENESFNEDNSIVLTFNVGDK